MKIGDRAEEKGGRPDGKKGEGGRIGGGKSCSTSFRRRNHISVLEQPEGSFRMNERMKVEQAIKFLQQKPMGSEDTFRFHCTACGECCKDRNDIILTPFDLFRVSKYLQRPMNEVFRENCESYVGHESRLPVVALRMKDDAEKSCPFLKDRKCIVHEAKPTVCALFPLGRGTDFEHGRIIYFLQNLTCGLQDETHTVREWISCLDLEASEEWFMAWSKSILSLMNMMQELEDLVPSDVFSDLEIVLFYYLYTNYEMEEDFLPQFERNASLAKAYLELAIYSYKEQ